MKESEIKRSKVLDVLSIYVPSFFNMLGMAIVSPILPIFALSFDVSFALASLAISMYAFGRFLADIPVGMTADRVGRKRVMLVGAAILAVMALLNANARGFWEFLAYRFIQGVGASMWMTGRQTLLADILKPEERGRILGYFQTFNLIGQSAGPTIGGIVAALWGLQATFYFFSLTAAITFLLTLVWVQEPKNLKQRKKGEDHFSPETVKRLLSNRTYAMACLATFTVFFMRTGIISTMVPLYADIVLHLSSAEIGTVVSYATLINLALAIPVGYAIDYFGRKPMIVRSLLVTTLAAFVFPMTSDYFQISLACALLGVGTSGAGQAPLALATDATINEPHGLSMGIYRLFGDVALVVGPILVGVIADNSGLRTPFYFVAAIILVNAVLLALFAKETYQRRQRKKETMKDTKD